MDAVEVNRPSPRQIRAAHTPLAVPQTDTGRWDENSKVLVRTLVQELGKMYP
jgi:hypothetical protein